MIKRRLRRVEITRQQEWRDDMFSKPGAMFRPDIREIALDFTPSDNTVPACQLHNHHRAVPHQPEGCLHRRRQRVAINRCLKAIDPDHIFNSILYWIQS